MKVFAVVLVVAALLVATACVYGAAIMLLVGILHAQVDWPTQTIGFGPSVAIGLLLSLVTSSLRLKASTV